MIFTSYVVSLTFVIASHLELEGRYLVAQQRFFHIQPMKKIATQRILCLLGACTKMLFDAAIISRPAGGLGPGRVCHALHVYEESGTGTLFPSSKSRVKNGLHVACIAWQLG